MNLPEDEDFLYTELSKAEAENNRLRKENAKLAHERRNLVALWEDSKDIVEYLQKHLQHTLNNDHSVVKAVAIESFDARYDCRKCASDWKSLCRFRECGGRL